MTGRRATIKEWRSAVEQTNNVAARYLAGGVSEEVMRSFFDAESEVFQSWGGPPLDKDWSEDTNR